MPGDMDFRCDGHFRAHELHKRGLFRSPRGRERAALVGPPMRVVVVGRHGRKKMDTTRSAWRLLAERGARGLDVVHALALGLAGRKRARAD